MLVSPLPSLGTFGSNCTTSYKFVVTLSALHFSDSRLLFFLDLTELHRIILCTVAFDAVKVVHSKIRRLSKMLHHAFRRPYTELSLCFKSSCSSSNAIRHVFMPCTRLYLRHCDCSCISLRIAVEKTCKTAKKRVLHGIN